MNERFAEIVAKQWRPGDSIWVHDYQLLLVPGMLRRRLPDARIGFFLHIPFPSSEVLRSLPHRERVLAGMLGADLVGFHTAAYARHFASSGLRVLGIASSVDRLRFGRPRGAPRHVPDGRGRGRFRGDCGGTDASSRKRECCAASRRRSSSSASTASTTPRASRADCSPTSGCCRESPRAPRQGALRAGGRAVAAGRGRLSGLPPRGGRADRPHPRAPSRRRTGCPSTGCTGASRASRWWRSTAPPT